MPSAESRVDKSHKDLEFSPSRDSTEGTVDHLNEAPRCTLCGFATTRLAFCDDGEVIGFCSGCDYVTSSRDGQPG